MACFDEQQFRSYTALKLTHALSVEAPLTTECLLSGASARFVCSRFGDEADENSLLALNTLRDARQRRGSFCKSGNGWNADVSRAASIATAALNRWHFGSVSADLVLSRELARASTLSPSTTICCLHDSALRLRSNSDEQKSLRCVLSTLGNCGRRRAANSNMNPHEAWLCDRLASEDLSTVESANLTSYASLLFSSALGELEAPLSWEVFLEKILPRALKNPASYSACLRLGDMCCALSAAIAVENGPFDFDCADTICILLKKNFEARMNFESRTRAFLNCTAVLESLVVADPHISEKSIWKKVMLEREYSWADALWCWCRGSGGNDDAHVWMEAVDAVLQSSGPALCVSLCEVVIVTCCVSPARLFRAEGQGECLDGRLVIVRLFVDRLLSQINSAPYSEAEMELLWIAAIARQLPLLSHPEYSRLRSDLFTHISDLVISNDESPSSLHVRASVLLSGLRDDRASDLSARLGVSACAQ